jgi:hypothetical protein
MEVQQQHCREFSSIILGAHVKPQGPLGLIPSHFSLLVPGETILV